MKGKGFVAKHYDGRDMSVLPRKVCVVTGTRAEYGQLHWLMKEIDSDDNLDLLLIVTGMHLSPEFGFTCDDIEKDGFAINYKVEMLLSSDSEVGISKSLGLGVLGFADALEQLKPDLLIVLGDRFEIFAAVSAATVARIPVVHLYGGETTEGAFDEAFRHSITKMSHIHFTSTEIYRNRVIQMGEQPRNVHNVGGLGIDSTQKLSLLSRSEFEDSIDFRLCKRNLMITFHPVTLENATAGEQFSILLSVLDELPDTHLIFTKANADNSGRIINKMIDEYVASNQKKSVAFSSLGQLRYLSAMQYVDGVVGNSSSGLIEAPSFKIGTVNIGSRQQGRIRADSILDCEPSKKSIRKALDALYSEPFQSVLEKTENPFGRGDAAERILAIIKETSLDGIIKKKFYDYGVM
jgi:GDP/UDP-N,N'-diacetylbacillosamine 2-epimerase (hydrolysing)